MKCTMWPYMSISILCLYCIFPKQVYRYRSDNFNIVSQYRYRSKFLDRFQVWTAITASVTCTLSCRFTEPKPQRINPLRGVSKIRPLYIFHFFVISHYFLLQEIMLGLYKIRKIPGWPLYTFRCEQISY